MILSRLALLLVSLQWLCILLGYAGESFALLARIVVVGSPVNMVMNFFANDFGLIAANKLFIGLAIFHILKYAIIVKAQLSNPENWAKIYAMILEILYIAYSGWLLY